MPGKRRRTRRPPTKAVDEKYQQWKATLPAEHQAWETTLKQCLGDFYLPLYKSGRVQGTEQAWDYVQDDPALPRVLLIGDSVSRGYTVPARKALAGKANVHRAPQNCGPTAEGVKKLDIWLGDGTWQVIHFNFGIHDRGTPLPEYEERLEQIVARLEKTGATLIWASTTPIPDDPAGTQTAASIVERNTIAARVMQKHGIAIDDLFTAVTPKLSEYHPPNDVHFNAAGYEFLGRKVAEEIAAALNLSTPVVPAGAAGAAAGDAPACPGEPVATADCACFLSRRGRREPAEEGRLISIF